jgi:hypothetical protein
VQDTQRVSHSQGHTRRHQFQPGIITEPLGSLTAGSYVYARRLLTNRGTEPLVLSAAQLTVGALMLGAALP